MTRAMSVRAGAAVLLAAVYAGSIYVSALATKLPQSGWLVVWLGAGVGLLAVHWLGVRQGLLAILLGHLPPILTYLSRSGEFDLLTRGVAAASTVGLDMLQAWLAARALRRHLSPRPRPDPAGVIRAIFDVCIVPALLTCPALVVKDAVLLGGSSFKGDRVLLDSAIVATGNALGLFLLAPLTVLGRRIWAETGGWRGLTLLLHLCLMPAILAVSFLFFPAGAVLVLPVALMVVTRHGALGAVLAVQVTAGSWLGLTAAGMGPFASGVASLAFFGLALGIMSLGATLLVVGLAVDHFRRHQDHLEFQVAERTRALEMTSASLRRAAERNARFVAWLGHEVRTPLNGILGMAQVMLREPRSSLDRERLDLVRGTGRHLQELLDDVLSRSRDEVDCLTMAPRAVAPAALLADVIAVMQADAVAKKVALRLEVTAAVGTARMVDALRLRQIAYNLVGNALKFAPEAPVDVVLDAHGDRLMLMVADRGRGIPDSRKAEIFAPFVQLGNDAQTGREGVGLGLAITRDLVAAAGGTVNVTDRPGGGCVFRVELPAPCTAESGPVAPVAPSLAAMATAGAGMDVLVVDDSPENRTVLRHALQPSGLNLIECDTAEAALATLRERMVDLVLMDVRLPGISGIEATRILRADQDPDRSLVPVIGLTADASAEVTDACLAAGMDAVLGKPLDLDRLLSLVAAHAPSTTMLALGPLPNFARLFANACPDHLAALRSAIAAQDRDALARIGHRVKGSAALLDDQAPFYAASRLDALASRRGAVPTDELRCAAAALEEALKRVLCNPMMPV